ncbi:diaminopimelate decarboxylase family protein [Butyrivibrio sp. MC2013]|uniref:diaminopimelate decarboxylase family protein n=1 Tax=Butyrivibrio sp. MC2013 TaxID=1280686 RepID=UPI00040A7EF2|nr:alanine racemase [Butyrivibrio sp. MC2013]
MDINRFQKIYEQYGSPSFVFDAERLRQRVDAIRDIFGENIRLAYSIKANPFLAKEMLEKVDALEVCSPGELEICEELGLSASSIVYSGVNKTLEDIKEAVRYGAGVYTAESLLHLQYLEEAAREIYKDSTGARGAVDTPQLSLPVLLRLTSGNQFGMSREDIFTAIEKRQDYPHLEFVGIHYFAGTQRKKTDKQIKELSVLRDFYDEISERFLIRLPRLEYGPGLAVPLFEGEDFEDSLQPARDIAAALKEAAGWADVTVEMGRFYVTECGYYLTRVMDIKENNGSAYVIVDGGMNHLSYLGQMMGMKVPRIRHLKPVADGDCILDGSAAGALESRDYCICGSLCTTADVLVRQLPLTDLGLGDLLVFENTGAYTVTEGIHLFLSRLMPRIILADGDDLRLLRDHVSAAFINTPRY